MPRWRYYDVTMTMLRWRCYDATIGSGTMAMVRCHEGDVHIVLSPSYHRHRDIATVTSPSHTLYKRDVTMVMARCHDGDVTMPRCYDGDVTMLWWRWHDVTMAMSRCYDGDVTMLRWRWHDANIVSSPSWHRHRGILTSPSWHRHRNILKIYYHRDIAHDDTMCLKQDSIYFKFSGVLFSN